MSNGSILELVAKGQLDEELIDINNKSSLFDFAINKKNKYTKGDTIFYPEGKANWGNTFRINIEKKGDLLYGLYIKVKLPKLSISNIGGLNENDPSTPYRITYVDSIGNALIEKASLYINGQLIDELSGDYMQVYTDLYVSDSNRKAMLGTDSILNLPNLKIQSEYIYIPLKYWFTLNNDKPLPVIALQNSDIYIDIQFRKFSECISVLEKDPNDRIFHSNKTHPEVPIEEVCLQANFYYLDLEERKKMATDDYEILITQTQIRNQTFSSNVNLEIDFNHIVKDIIFFVQPVKHKTYGEYFNFSAKLKYPPPELFSSSINFELWYLEPHRHLLSRARMLFNGIERIEWRDAKYYYYMQNHENYRNTLQSYVYVYSFNINPTKDTNFSGCNFSRLDNAQLQMEVKPNPFILNTSLLTYPTDDTYELKCYATNFNILVIKGGLVGLKYTC